MLTPPSSAVVPFEPRRPAAPASQKGSFEAWRERWVRAVFADEDLWNSDKSVAAFLALHLNRETRTCWPSYTTIGNGLGINRSNVRRSIRRLIARGYRAVGKVFIRYGRVEGAWIPAADLRAIEALAAAEGKTS